MGADSCGGLPAHGEQELGFDFLLALQGNVEAKRRGHSEQGKGRL